MMELQVPPSDAFTKLDGFIAPHELNNIATAPRATNISFFIFSLGGYIP